MHYEIFFIKLCHEHHVSFCTFLQRIASFQNLIFKECYYSAIYKQQCLLLNGFNGPWICPTATAFICFCWYQKARQQDKKLLQQKVCQIEEGAQTNS
jgi:hypothetical protein